MDKVRNNFVIFYTIMGVANAEIDFNEFYSQVKKNAIYIKNLGYQVEKIESSDIYSFFRAYTLIGKLAKGKIIISNKITKKQKEFFYRGVDSNLIDTIKENNRFVFPILFENQVINYTFITSNQYLNEIKNNFYYDSIKNKAYIIDLTKIDDKKIYNSLVCFLEYFVSKHYISKETFNYDELGKLFNLSYLIKTGNLSDICQSFNLSDEFNKIELMYEMLFYYSNVAYNNKVNLEHDDKVLRKLTK